MNEREFEDFLRRFIATSRERVDEIAKKVTSLFEGHLEPAEADQAVFEALRELHKLSGAGASVGFPQLSEKAGILEAELEGIGPGTAAPRSRDAINAALVELQRTTERLSPEKSEIRDTLRFDATPERRDPD